MKPWFSLIAVVVAVLIASSEAADWNRWKQCSIPQQWYNPPPELTDTRDGYTTCYRWCMGYYQLRGQCMSNGYCECYP